MFAFFPLVLTAIYTCSSPRPDQITWTPFNGTIELQWPRAGTKKATISGRINDDVGFFNMVSHVF